MTPRKSAPKKRARKAAPKYASKAEHDALAADLAHVKAVLNRRLGFNIDAEPEDIVEE